ncbi:MAG: hypothetical protein HN350_11555 [Phycisphaerales bacterium]|jgi:hypothetical protein|nr:hypothetical protein [Phycisphaerales bacterium]
MAKFQRAILFDADVIIKLHEWGCWGKLCKQLNSLACVSHFVATEEARYYRDRITHKSRPIRLGNLNADSIPRLVSLDDLSNEEYAQYLQYFSTLEVADAGERETFALAWALEYDVCSRDTAARDIFFTHRPQGCRSKHMDIMPLLRTLKIIAR